MLVTENELEILCEEKHQENEENEEAITEKDNDDNNNDSSHTIAVCDQIQEVLETTKLVAPEDSEQITDTSKPLSPCPAYDTEQETASVAKR